MSTAKFEKLIDLIINEDQERAEQLFHEIVVEKSREIYEGLMSEDMTTGLLDEIEMEEEGMDGMMEADEDMEFTADEEIDGDFDVDGGEEEEFGADDMEAGDEEDFGDMDGEEDMGDEEGDLEDRVVDLEDKLDELMAEFEAQMGGEGGDEEIEVDAEEELAEGFEGKPVKGLYGSKIGGDDGAQKVSPVAKNSGAAGMASKPVSITGGDEKGRAAPTAQKVQGSFKNAPGGDGSKGATAPKPVTKDEAGKVKSPVAESRTAKRRI